MDMFIQFVISRMKERSTWIGLVGLLSSLGVAMKPDMVEAIASVGVALSAVVMILTKDLSKKVAEQAADKAIEKTAK